MRAFRSQVRTRCKCATQLAAQLVPGAASAPLRFAARQRHRREGRSRAARRKHGPPPPSVRPSTGAASAGDCPVGVRPPGRAPCRPRSGGGGEGEQRGAGQSAARGCASHAPRGVGAAAAGQHQRAACRGHNPFLSDGLGWWPGARLDGGWHVAGLPLRQGVLECVCVCSAQTAPAEPKAAAAGPAAPRLPASRGRMARATPGARHTPTPAPALRASTAPPAQVASAPGKWLRAKIPAAAGAGGSNGAGAAAPPLLEFVVTNGKGDWDKPATGGNYEVAAPGIYALRGGALAPVKGTPVCLVSDLDGTMVGISAGNRRASRVEASPHLQTPSSGAFGGCLGACGQRLPCAPPRSPHPAATLPRPPLARRRSAMTRRPRRSRPGGRTWEWSGAACSCTIPDGGWGRAPARARQGTRAPGGELRLRLHVHAHAQS